MYRSEIRVSQFALMAFLMCFAIMYTYGRSITILYGGIELLIAFFCYKGFLTRFNRIDGTLGALCLLVVMSTWLTGLFYGDLKSTLLITVPIIMPLYISTLNIAYSGNNDFMLAAVGAVIVTFLAIIWNLFGNFNSNTIGFVGFMGVSLGFPWIKSARFKVIPLTIVLFGILCAAMSGSRNVAVTGLACICLLLLPDAILRKKSVFFLITGFVLAYTIFSADIMAWGFSIPAINDFLLEFTGRYSQKAWSMAARVDYLRIIQSHIAERNILQQMFGTGTLTIHGHNMFYQSVLEFGYLGTSLIYIMFFRIFKFGYVLIKEKHDRVAMGCAVALWGNFLLQGADVYLLGPESYAVVPQVLMGIILQRYSVYRYERFSERLAGKSDRKWN